MASAEGTVLFHRGAGNEDECDSDIWDDTALIEAYDAAVAPLKAKLAEHTGDTSVLEGTNKTADSGQSRKKKNKNKKTRQAKKKKQQTRGWAVGDHCQAVYTEDGVIYEAKIISISTEDDTCVIRYLGYGNEEEQTLEDLIHPERFTRKQRRSDSVSVSETDSVSSASQQMGKKSRALNNPCHPSAFPSFGQGSSTVPPPPPPPPFYPGVPNHPSFGMPQPPMGSAASMPFSMMPPPPPPMPNDNATNENEALCSMLLSWYMSGYHTGYYQGLKQGHQQDASAAMGPAR